MRLFVALSLPDAVVDAIAQWRQQTAVLLPEAHWRALPDRLWHITMAFYGDIDGRDIDALADQLAECAGCSYPLALQLSGFGVFPRPMHPRVFWVGVHAPEQRKAFARLAHCCRRAGHATVRQHKAGSAFHAHITVARSRGVVKPLDSEVFQTVAPIPKITWQADQLELFQSILSPQGPEYRRLESFKLRRY